MTTYDLAVAVCGATKPCPVSHDVTHDSTGQTRAVNCPQCPNRLDEPLGSVFVLGMRARKPCPDSGEEIDTNQEGRRIEYGYRRFQSQFHARCQGRGWLPAILLSEEPGSTTQCVDEGLLRDLMEEIGEHVDYCTSAGWWIESDHLPLPNRHSTLLEAAAKALGVEAIA